MKHDDVFQLGKLNDPAVPKARKSNSDYDEINYERVFRLFGNESNFSNGQFSKRSKKIIRRSTRLVRPCVSLYLCMNLEILKVPRNFRSANRC